MRRIVTMLSAAILCLATCFESASAAEIHSAAGAGSLDALDSLLTADKTLLESVDARGFTPLWLAALRGQTKAIELLLDRGADATKPCEPYGELIDVAFMTECRSSQELAITKLLVQHGARFDPNRQNRIGLVPLRMAVAFGNLPAARWLLELGATIDQVSEKDGLTALNDAALRNRTDIALLLIAKGAKINTVDQDGCSPLWYACRAGNIVLTDSLLAHGADYAPADMHYGRTPLHNAALRGYPEITGLLLKAGADAKALDSEQRTPLQLAAQYGHRAVLEVLQKSQQTSDSTAVLATSTEGRKRPNPNSAVMWYLNNRGWAVRTSDHLLIFDYEEFNLVKPAEPSLVNGFIVLPEIKDESLVGLYTCFHADSGEFSYLHAIGDSIDRVAFVHNADDPWRGGRNAHYLRPWENVTIDNAQIQTFRTTGPEFMPTLTYLVSVDGLNIVYVGFVTDDLTAYRDALDSIAKCGSEVDIAFLPIPDVNQIDSSDLRLFVETLHPRTVVLHDPDRREYLLPAIADRIRSLGDITAILFPENPGDRMTYRKDN